MRGSAYHCDWRSYVLSGWVTRLFCTQYLCIIVRSGLCKSLMSHMIKSCAWSAFLLYTCLFLIKGWSCCCLMRSLKTPSSVGKPIRQDSNLKCIFERACDWPLLVVEEDIRYLQETPCWKCFKQIRRGTTLVKPAKWDWLYFFKTNLIQSDWSF